MAVRDKQVVVVTGCSAGGIGWHLCADMAAAGALVYATARRVNAMEGLQERGCRLVQLDVTDKASVQKAVDHIIAEAGRIDGAYVLFGCPVSGRGSLHTAQKQCLFPHSRIPILTSSYCYTTNHSAGEQCWRSDAQAPA